ncbi:MAG TPA: hypothetical protein VF627_09930 [Abditibacterium sp.]|jgi:hypothetical protein
MKKLLLLGLSASLLATAAHAQPQLNLEPVTPSGDKITLLLPNIPAATGLEAVVGTPVFILKRGRYEAKDLMETLALKTGGKAIFVDSFQATPINIIVPLRGTAPELIKRMADFGVAAGQIGADWVFLPVQSRFPQGVQLFRSAPTRYLRILPESRPSATKPTPFIFNLNPKPGQNLPPDAKPFDFNGERLYHVPIRPNAR